ncbi:hypothetical protein HDV05_004904 [Chytridiales sp. JEL 0842]|nr:hypothetical protein HDV05_004904 [Chytridiales sp. JEL 0842]
MHTQIRIRGALAIEIEFGGEETFAADDPKDEGGTPKPALDDVGEGDDVVEHDRTHAAEEMLECERVNPETASDTREDVATDDDDADDDDRQESGDEQLRRLRAKVDIVTDRLIFS